MFNIICNSFVHSFILSFGRSFRVFAEMCETDIKRKISLCEELLKVVRVLEPGKSIFRGKLLVDLQNALFALIDQRVKNGEISKLVALVCIFILLYTHSFQLHSQTYRNIRKSGNIKISSISLSFLFS